MTLPHFIGIGVQKGGTSWLHKQLLCHPEVFVPESRKEVHFFDWYFERGTKWYQKWFPENANNYRTIGEITPNYIYDNNIALRVKQTIPDAKFIVILRHPVKRAYSHYQMIFQSGEGFKYKNFSSFMENHPHGFKRGLYGSQLQNWLLHFDQNQFLVLISEELSGTPEQLETTFQKVGNFLGVNPELFDRKLAQKRIGEARSLPRFPWIMKVAQSLRQGLQRLDLDFIALWLKKRGITRQLFASNKLMPPLSDEDRQKWIIAYQDDIKKLEKLLGRSFSHWS